MNFAGRRSSYLRVHNEIVEGPEVTTLLEEIESTTGREDPYSRYARLREISPVVRAGDGAVVVTRHAECLALVRDPRFGHMPPHMLAFMGFADWADHPGLQMLLTSLVTIDPPDHTRLRRLVSSQFTARRVQALLPEVERIVGEFLDGLDGTDDLISSFAFPLPVNVIGELLGVPAADRPQFQTLVLDISQLLEGVTPATVAVADPAAVTMGAYLADLAAERRRKPQDDLLSALVAAEQEGDRGEEPIADCGRKLQPGHLLGHPLGVENDCLSRPATAHRIRGQIAPGTCAVW